MLAQGKAKAKGNLKASVCAKVATFAIPCIIMNVSSYMIVVYNHISSISSYIIMCHHIIIYHHIISYKILQQTYTRVRLITHKASICKLALPF